MYNYYRSISLSLYIYIYTFITPFVRFISSQCGQWGCRVLYRCAFPASTGNHLITGKTSNLTLSDLKLSFAHMSDLQTYRLPSVRVIRLSNLQLLSFPILEDCAALEFDPTIKRCKFEHVYIWTLDMLVVLSFLFLSTSTYVYIYIYMYLRVYPKPMFK